MRLVICFISCVNLSARYLWLRNVHLPTLSPSSGDDVKSSACHSHCMIKIVHGDMNSCASFCCDFRRSRLPCTNRWWAQQELYVEISNRMCRWRSCRSSQDNLDADLRSPDGVW